MKVPAKSRTASLPALIDRANEALASARTSAEVLEARDMSCAAYGVAKSAGRIARAKQAHDSILAEIDRVQAHCLAIRVRAGIRLAEECNAAQTGASAGPGYRSSHVGAKREVRSVFSPLVHWVPRSPLWRFMWDALGFCVFILLLFLFLLFTPG